MFVHVNWINLIVLIHLIEQIYANSKHLNKCIFLNMIV